MAYEYIKAFYGVTPIVGRRVTVKEKPTLHGTITRYRSGSEHYVWVRMDDGQTRPLAWHPNDLIYHEKGHKQWNHRRKPQPIPDGPFLS